MHRGVLRSLTTWFRKQVPLGDNRKKKLSRNGGIFLWLYCYDILNLYMRHILLKHLSIFVFVIFIVNLAATFFGWYSIFSWFDNMMHFFGGAWLALVACWLWYTKYTRGILHIGSVLIFVFVGAFLWEILEYVVQYIAQSPGSLATIPDSISDIVFGLLGGLLLGSRTIQTIKKQR